MNVYTLFCYIPVNKSSLPLSYVALILRKSTVAQP